MLTSELALITSIITSEGIKAITEGSSVVAVLL